MLVLFRMRHQTHYSLLSCVYARGCKLPHAGMLSGLRLLARPFPYINCVKNCTPACNIVMNGTVLKQVNKFNYLGSLITSDGRCINEIKRRMAQAKASFQNMKSILTNKRLSLGVRKRVLPCYIEPILLYGCES